MDAPVQELPSTQTLRRRAACDECRTKKLKCTGELPACTRCVREHITCLYSPQKQMGRPKKRANPDDASPTTLNTRRRLSTSNAWNSSDADLAFENVLTPGGSLQPWLQWNGDFSAPDDIYGGVPALTPDKSASQSPPLLNLPAELRSTNPSTGNKPTHQNNSTQLLLDPTLGSSSNDFGIPSSLIPDCACLSTMYLTLNTLQSMKDEEAFTFPMALHPLREAMQTASSVLACEECPTRFITGFQNTQLVGTLLMSICERFGKVLDHITSASVRAQLAGEKKKFRLADLNSSNSHLHTGGLGCAAAFSLSLSSDEWKDMAKKVVRAEVEGPSEGNDCCCYLMGVIKQMEDRQERWHKKRPAAIEDFPRDREGVLINPSGQKGDHLCLRLVKIAKHLVEELDWS